MKKLKIEKFKTKSDNQNQNHIHSDVSCMDLQPPGFFLQITEMSSFNRTIISRATLPFLLACYENH